LGAVVYFFFSISGLAGPEAKLHRKWGWFWKIFFMPMLIALFLAQLHAAKILYALSKRCTDSEHVTDVCIRPTLTRQMATRRHLNNQEILDAFENSSAKRSFRKSVCSIMSIKNLDTTNLDQKEEFDDENP
jgi:hypothetical protein